MQEAEALRGVAAAISIASGLGLAVDDCVVLSDSNRLVVRLLPCDVVARVTPSTHFASAELEVEVARRLARTEAPIAALDERVEPRIYERDDFDITLWIYWDPDHRAVTPDEYVQALSRLHSGLRQIELPVPNFLARSAANQRDVDSHAITPELSEEDRALLASTLQDLPPSIVERGAPQQLLHGEPHPWNMLSTKHGPRFIDFENLTVGPLEYDLAWVPDAVSKLYPDTDLDLVNSCRGLVLAIIATHRWTRGDQHPSGRESGVAFLQALRQGPPWPAIDEVRW